MSSQSMIISHLFWGLSKPNGDGVTLNEAEIQQGISMSIRLLLNIYTVFTSAYDNITVKSMNIIDVFALL